MGAERTGGMDCVTQTGEKDLAFSFEVDLFPESGDECLLRSASRRFLHFTILELGIVEDCDSLCRHSANLLVGVEEETI